jgi:hypothetical protein
MKSEMRQCKMVQASRMSDLSALIDKFRRIGAARATGDMRGARKLFRTIKVSDFPVMPRFQTSRGILANAETALFFIDLDWRDEEWCPRFISDVISALERFRHDDGDGAAFGDQEAVGGHARRAKDSRHHRVQCACEIGGDEAVDTPATRIVSAITDLTNRIGEAARSINKAYDAVLKKEMDLEVAFEDSFFCNPKGPRRVAKKILLMKLPMLRDNKHRWRMRFTYDCSNTRIRWSVGLQTLRGFFHIETFDGVLTLCPGIDELRRRRKARK